MNDAEMVTKRIIFVLIFFGLVLIGKNINFSPLTGAENQFFTLFQFFGPIAGAFLGTVWGVVVVFFSQVADILILGKSQSLITVLRLLPMLFAVYYFSTFSRARRTQKLLQIIVPLICIALFVLHPVGRAVWFFSLYWLIPVLAAVIPRKWPGQLFFRSYGATFMAHAVGGALWIYSVPMTAGQWIGLLPVVAYERFLFGLGIAGSYILFTTVLEYLTEKLKINVPAQIVAVEKKYSLPQLLRLRQKAV